MKEIGFGVRVFRSRALIVSLVCLVLSFFVTGAWGAIPVEERTALMNIYTSTNGDGWTNRDGWNGAAGTECTWHGITCGPQSNHVVSIDLSSNNLTGSLPALAVYVSGTYYGLTYLQTFDVADNQLTGSIPSLSGLTNLQTFTVYYNHLTGSIPSLSGLTSLQTFNAAHNQLTDPIPSLSGLTSLQTFEVDKNQLTGSIPSLSGLNNLTYFIVSDNQLSGSIPSLSGLTNLAYFYVFYNQLSGSIPSLSGLTNLHYFEAFSNQLTGSIPSLSGLTNLVTFDVSDNQLTGSIPSLSGLTNLEDFDVSDNRLTGSIPSMSGLTSLHEFFVSNDQLTGSIPSLCGLTNLQHFSVDNNFLTGDVPAVPDPDNLLAGYSSLCPNYLNSAGDPAWDAATGSTPWYQDCTAPPPTHGVTYDGNGNTGGAVPVDGNPYFPGQLVTVSGNSGALYQTGNSFLGWNTAANGSGISYSGDDTFLMGAADTTLYAQWETLVGPQVDIEETLAGYSDIQSAYNALEDGQTILARDGLGSQNALLFSDPNIVSFKLRGGYNDGFTNDTGDTLVIGGIEIRDGCVEMSKIIIQ